MYVDIAVRTKSPPRRYEGDRTPEIQGAVPCGTIFQLGDNNDVSATTDVVRVTGADDVVNPKAGQVYGDAQALLFKSIEAVRGLGAAAA